MGSVPSCTTYPETTVQFSSGARLERFCLRKHVGTPRLVRTPPVESQLRLAGGGWLAQQEGLPADQLRWWQGALDFWELGWKSSVQRCTIGCCKKCHDSLEQGRELDLWAGLTQLYTPRFAQTLRFLVCAV